MFGTLSTTFIKKNVKKTLLFRLNNYVTGEDMGCAITVRLATVLRVRIQFPYLRNELPTTDYRTVFRNRLSM